MGRASLKLLKLHTVRHPTVAYEVTYIIQVVLNKNVLLKPETRTLKNINFGKDPPLDPFHRRLSGSL
jgi:hypothetical protein